MRRRSLAAKLRELADCGHRRAARLREEADRFEHDHSTALACGIDSEMLERCGKAWERAHTLLVDALAEHGAAPQPGGAPLTGPGKSG